MNISIQTRQLVRQRAGDCCEYCLMPQSGGTVTFHVDHIVPRKHGGLDVAENLCLACYQCNGYKGADIAGYAPDTGELTRLYHPRSDQWNDHFLLHEDGIIAGKTAEGRVTSEILRFNTDRRIEQRLILIEVDFYPCLPPTED